MQYSNTYLFLWFYGMYQPAFWSFSEFQALAMNSHLKQRFLSPLTGASACEPCSPGTYSNSTGADAVDPPRPLSVRLWASFKRAIKHYKEPEMINMAM
jgi:hypothetical protein